MKLSSFCQMLDAFGGGVAIAAFSRRHDALTGNALSELNGFTQCSSVHGGGTRTGAETGAHTLGELGARSAAITDLVCSLALCRRNGWRIPVFARLHPRPPALRSSIARILSSPTFRRPLRRSNPNQPLPFTIHAARHTFQMFTPPPPRTWVHSRRFLPSAIPSCATASKKRRSRCDVMRRPREQPAPSSRSSRRFRTARVYSEPPAGRHASRSPCIPGAPADTPPAARVDLLRRPAAGVAGRGGRDTPTPVPKSSRARRSSRRRTTPPRMRIFLSHTRAVLGPAATLPRTRCDSPLHAKHPCCQRPRPSSFPRTIGVGLVTR